MTEAAAIKEAAAINAEMISTLLVIYRIARRALRARGERHAVAGLELHWRHDQERRLVVAVPDADIVDLDD